MDFTDQERALLWRAARYLLGELESALVRFTPEIYKDSEASRRELEIEVQLLTALVAQLDVSDQ